LEIKERKEAEERLFKLRELEFAERKLNEEKQIKLMEDEAAARKAQEEAKERRFKDEMTLRKAEIKRLQDLDEARKVKESSLAAKTLKFSEAVKNVFVKMTKDPAEAPMFFDGLENLFKMYEIPEDHKSKLLLELKFNLIKFQE